MKVKPRRLYVALEGIDGIGKTTQMGSITNRLISLGFPKEIIIHVKEPWEGSLITKLLREEYLSGKSKASPEVIQQLMAAARTDMFDNYLDHIEDNIDAPAYIILSDRSILSSMAYYGGNINNIFNFNSNIIEYTIEDRIPDCILLFTANKSIIESRMNKRESHEIFEETNKLMKIQKDYIYVKDYIDRHNNSNKCKKLSNAIYEISVVPEHPTSNECRSVDEITDIAMDIISEAALKNGIIIK